MRTLTQITRALFSALIDRWHALKDSAGGRALPYYTARYVTAYYLTWLRRHRRAGSRHAHFFVFIRSGAALIASEKEFFLACEMIAQRTGWHPFKGSLGAGCHAATINPVQALADHPDHWMPFTRWMITQELWDGTDDDIAKAGMRYAMELGGELEFEREEPQP